MRPLAKHKAFVTQINYINARDKLRHKTYLGEAGQVKIRFLKRNTHIRKIQKRTKTELVPVIESV